MKEKRKTRLDKGSSSEFIGFNAFATVGTPGATTSPATGDSATTTHTAATISWSPIYTGSDSGVQTAFSWLTSKRDSVTHVKALRSLTDYLRQEDVPKKLQVLVVQHWIWLYHRKTYFDATAAVRAAALQLWIAIRERLPKAFGNLVERRAAATASTDASVVLGMLYSHAFVDTSTEVQQITNTNAATQTILFAGLYTGSGGDIDWESGILGFAEYILSCGRPSVFYERLLQGKKSTQTSAFAELSEDQKDAVLETYTRVTGNALDTLVLYLQSRRPNNVLALPANTNTTTWFRTLASSHAKLRRHTYHLVSAVSMHCLDLQPPSLTQSLSSEKEPANWPALLEALLAVTRASGEKLKAEYVQPITKAWKKALYGANMSATGPMLLPLSAVMGSPMQVWKLLRASFDGRELTLGGKDRWRMVQAIAECLSFGLLRKQENEEILSQYHMEWPELYGTIVVETVTTDPSRLTGTTKAAHDEVLKSLGKQLVQFESALKKFQGSIHSSPSNALESLTKGSSQPVVANLLVPLLDESSVKAIPLSSKSLLFMLNNAETLLAAGTSPFLPTFRSVFDSLCPRKASGDVPTVADYEAMQVLMDRMSCKHLFDQTGTFTLIKFIMNDLLRWTIIHSSTLSVGQSDSETWVRHDFSLLRNCIDSFDEAEDKRSVWVPFLREVVLAKCDLGCLAIGLKTLVTDTSHSDTSWIRCDGLDDFVKTIEEHIVHHDSDESTSEFSQEESVEDQGAMQFLAVCCGISDGLDTVLVDASVVKSLTASVAKANCIYGSKPSPVERTLVRIIRHGPGNLLDATEEIDVLMHAWAVGSHQLTEEINECFSKRKDLAGRFISKASSQAKADLKDPQILESRNGISERKVWASRVSDLFHFCNTFGTASSSFLLVGLSDLQIWESHPSLCFDLSMYLFGHIFHTHDRFALLSSDSDVSTVEFFVSILTALSEATHDMIKAQVVSTRNDMCAKFLQSVEGPELDKTFLESCIKNVASRLKTLCQSPDENMTCRQVAVLSQLVGALFCPIADVSQPEISPESIKEGDELYYIPDTTKPDESVVAEVVTAHYDSVAGYYFSIKLLRNGECQERQTVASRLRKNSSSRSPANSIDPSSMTPEEKLLRGSLRSMLLQDIVIPFFDTLSWRTCVAEVVNIVIAQLGVGDTRGLGSSHYDIFQLLKRELEICQAALVDRNMEHFDQVSMKLALACGLGVVVPSFKWVSSIFQLDILPLTDALQSDFEFLQMHVNPFSMLALQCAVGDSTSSLTDVAPFMKRVVTESSGHFNSGTLLVLKRLNQLLPNLTLTETENLGDCVDHLISGFATSWGGSEADVWSIYLQETFNLVTSRQHLAPIFHDSAKSSSEALSSCLHSSSKQWIAFQLLQGMSNRNCPLRDEAEIVLADSTQAKLGSWTKDYTEEERDEALQDIEIVSQWLPLSMMTDLETWVDGAFESMNDVDSTGKLLVWLSVLEIVDQAAPIDYQNRPAFVTYLSLTGSLDAILSMAVLLNPFVNDPKGASKKGFLQNDSLGSISDINVENLSSLVLLRTTEVLPSLVRRWWEAECPKVYTTPVQVLVEKHIAPAILGRELSRLKTSSEQFGEMEVSGSAVSREITAAYVQDDFKLRVFIKLPNSFPLRSAEVDCSKTFGVPPKRWKRWSLQITQMLNNQGGTLHDALQLWKENVDQEFEGIEPCPVCYSVLHVKTHKLPQLECTTCHNRFHTDCLQQWFRSSGKSQCVLCQQDWRGTRV